MSGFYPLIFCSHFTEIGGGFLEKAGYFPKNKKIFKRLIRACEGHLRE